MRCSMLLLLLLAAPALAAKDVENLIDRLKDHGERRLDALEELARMGPRAKDALIPVKLLASRGPGEVQEFAFRAYRRIGGNVALLVPGFTGKLGKELASWRREAAWGLFLAAPDSYQAVKALKAKLEDEDEQVRVSVAAALLALEADEEAAAKVLLPAVSSKDAEVRARALQGLAARKSGEDSERFIDAVSDGTPRVRRVAARILYGIGVKAKKAIPTLILRLADEDRRTLSMVILTVSRMAVYAKDAVPGITKCLKHKHRHVRLVAARSLGGFGAHAKSAVLPLLYTLDDRDTQVMTAAAGSLGRLGAVAVPILTKALTEEKKWQHREYAAVVLSGIPFLAKPAIPALTKAAADDPEERVRQACKGALRKIAAVK